MKDKYSVPKSMKEKVEPIIKEIEVFCEENLNENFKDKAIELTSKLSRKRPSPLNKGRAKTWASGILDTIMKINFIYDPENPLYMMKKDFVQKIGVSQNTINKKSNEIMDLLNISILSDEWFVEGNEFTMSDVLQMQEEMFNVFASMGLDIDEEDFDTIEDEEINREKSLELIGSQNIDILDEEELEYFCAICLQVACFIGEELAEEFEEDDYYEERLTEITIVLNKACDATKRLIKLNDKKIKPYYDVLYMKGEIAKSTNDLKTALESYEKIDKDYPNYPISMKCNIFNIKYLMNDNAGEYLKSIEKDKDAMWEYNSAIYNYSIGNELMAFKHLKEGIRKNRKISEILLDEIRPDLRCDLSPLEIEAVDYYVTSEWIWRQTEGVLEWMFYKR